VASLGSYRYVYVFTHIGLALGIVQAFTGGFLVVMHDDEINWPSWCLVHYPRHFRISCVRPGDPGELLELTHCMIQRNQSDLYIVSLPFPVFHASDGLVMCRLGPKALSQPKPALKSPAQPEPFTAQWGLWLGLWILKARSRSLSLGYPIHP
jgi:hypothetical protein